MRWLRAPCGGGRGVGRIALVASFVLLAFGVGVHAVPAAPLVTTLVQPNGKEFQARVVGDEWAHWTETVDGYTILRDEASGYWFYASLSPEGDLVPSEAAVGVGVPADLARHLRPVEPPTAPRENVGFAEPGPPRVPPVLGSHWTLVILVQFTNQGLVGTNAAYWSNLFFGGTGSIDDYYNEVSYGQLRLSAAPESHANPPPGGIADGIITVTLPYVHPNPASTGDANRQVVRDAIIAADPFVTYSGFDLNFDGYLTTSELHVVTVIAGYEGSYGTTACGNSIWAHQWSLDWPFGGGTVLAPLVDGVYVGCYNWGNPGAYGGYTQVGEWHCDLVTDFPGHAATIGVATHELGHDMGTGVPDFYDTDGSCAGIGNWCLQAAGSWGTTALPGDTPVHWCAWAKWMMGLVTPTQITVNTTGVSFPRVEDATGASHGVYQLLNNPAGVDWDWGSPGTGEYFLLENRQQFGYDSALPGAGLCIWHIYEPAPGNNTANANEGGAPPGNPRLVVLEQRDGNYDLEGFGGTNPNGINNRGDTTDPWVSSFVFDDSSTPNSKLYAGTSTWVSVSNISASGNPMTADIALTQPGPPPTAAVFRVESTGNMLADQTVYGASFQVGSADVAEWVQISEPVEPGDVLELDPEHPGQYRKARDGCASLVAGVVSTDAGVLLGELIGGERVPMALVGIVPVKACDEGGPIEPGDLLVPASIPGYVKRWDPESDAGCPLVGKALAPLVSGMGVLLALLVC